MTWIIGPFTIGPQPVRHTYWWNDPQGPQLALAGPVMDPVSTSNGVKTVAQGFSLNESCVYWVDVEWEDVSGTGSFGTYNITGGEW